MDASPMPPEFIRELEALRRRAYGLGADIGADPAALRRLDELESALHPLPSDDAFRNGGTAVHADARYLVAERPAAATLVRGDSRGERLGLDRQRPGGSPQLRQPSVRTATMVVTAIVALGWVAGILSTPQSDTVLTATQSTQQERQDLIDQVDLASVGMVGAHLRSFTEFRDLSVWSASSASGVTCLLVQSDGEGVFHLGCTPAPLQPSIDLRVGEQVRPELVGDLPIGSVVRLALRGGEVGVWTAEASP